MPLCVLHFGRVWEVLFRALRVDTWGYVVAHRVAAIRGAEIRRMFAFPGCERGDSGGRGFLGRAEPVPCQGLDAQQVKEAHQTPWEALTTSTSAGATPACAMPMLGGGMSGRWPPKLPKAR